MLTRRFRRMLFGVCAVLCRPPVCAVCSPLSTLLASAWALGASSWARVCARLPRRASLRRLRRSDAAQLRSVAERIVGVADGLTLERIEPRNANGRRASKDTRHC